MKFFQFYARTLILQQEKFSQIDVFAEIRLLTDTFAEFSTNEISQVFAGFLENLRNSQHPLDFWEILGT